MSWPRHIQIPGEIEAPEPRSRGKEREPQGEQGVLAKKERHALFQTPLLSGYAMHSPVPARQALRDHRDTCAATCGTIVLTFGSLPPLRLVHDVEAGSKELVEQSTFTGTLGAKDGDYIVSEALFEHVPS